MTVCHVCGTENPDSATYCEGCGVELKAGQAPAQAPQADPAPYSAPAIPDTSGTDASVSYTHLTLPTN